MGKLILLQGPKSSGKSEWATRWRAEQPDKRRLADTITGAVALLLIGFDVAVDADEIRNDGTEVEVHTFG